MEQFVIKPIIPLKVGDVDISFTNSALFMVLAVVVSTVLLGLCLRRRSIVPTVAQSIPESIYEFISGLLKENVGMEGLKYFPFIFTLFLFVAFGNLFGVVSLCVYVYVPFNRGRKFIFDSIVVQCGYRH